MQWSPDCNVQLVRVRSRIDRGRVHHQHMFAALQGMKGTLSVVLIELRQYSRAMSPPSIARTAPLTKLAAFEHSHVIAAAVS